MRLKGKVILVVGAGEGTERFEQNHAFDFLGKRAGVKQTHAAA